MKKNLLLGLALVAASSSAFATTDGFTYAPVDGVTCENLWIYAQDINKAEFDAYFGELGMMSSYNRSITVYDGKIYTSVGSVVTVGEGDDAVSTNPWNLVVIDIKTGEVLKNVPMTIDGEPLNGLLAAVNIGYDDFGHIWVSSYCPGVEDNPTVKPYVVDTETGALTALPWIVFAPDDYSSMGRMDFVDFCGDITGEEGEGYFIGCSNVVESDPFAAFRFVLPQGGEEWEPGMEGYPGWLSEDIRVWPEAAASWGDYPTAVWANGSNEICYLSGRATVPGQYSCAGGMAETLGTFEDAAPDCCPAKPGAPGAWEFSLGDHMYLGYGNGQGAEGGKFTISRMGGDAEGGTFEGMTLAWDFPPADVEGASFTSISNEGGTHPVMAWVEKDANGKEGAYVASFYRKAMLGVYLIAEEGFQPVGVSTINNDNNNAAVEYFNLQGMKVQNPENGLYIRRQGNNVSKVVL